MDDVFQLADIARPGITADEIQAIGVQALARQAVLMTEPLQGGLSQFLGVALALAQGRHAQRQHVQPVQQVLAELSGPSQLIEIGVAGHQHADIHLTQTAATDPSIGAVLQEAQQRRLRLAAQRIDLIQEQGAAGRLTDQTGRGGLGVGEGTALVAEQFAFHQRIGQGTAVDRDEWLVGASAQVVDGAGGKFLAGAGLAGNQHGRIQPCHAVDLCHHRLETRRGTDQVDARMQFHRFSPAAATPEDPPSAYSMQVVAIAGT